MTKKLSKEIKKEIQEISKQIILQEEIVKQKEEIQKQLAQAQQQITFWDTKVKQLAGALAAYNTMLQKCQKAKILELQSGNTNPKKK